MKASLFFDGGVKIDFEGNGQFMEMPYDYRMEMEFEALPRKGDFICFGEFDCFSLLNNSESFEVVEIVFYAMPHGPSTIQIVLKPEE